MIETRKKTEVQSCFLLKRRRVNPLVLSQLGSPNTQITGDDRFRLQANTLGNLTVLLLLGGRIFR